jgi:hypothetical protein
MIAASSDQWRRDRLAEARGVLADVAHNPDTLIILAARVVSQHTDEANECAEAIDLLRLLDGLPKHVATAAAAGPTGSAA